MSEFLTNTVNLRFRQVYKQLEKDGQIKGKSDIAERLGTYNHVIGDILKGKRNLTVEQINKLVDLFGINANFLFGNSDQMFMHHHSDGNAVPSFSFAEKILDGRNNITLVPQKAMAGYAIGVAQDPDYMNQFKRFSIPGIEGDLLAFEISGDSMLPNITDGDIVICERVQPEAGQLRLKENTVYVIVSDDIVAKRVQQVREGGELARLRLISDNDAFYKPYEVDIENVKQILQVKFRLTDYGVS